MLVGQEGQAASVLLGPQRLATLLVKLHLWQFFNQKSNMLAGYTNMQPDILTFGHIRTCAGREFPSVVQRRVLNLMLFCLMLSQHAPAKDE